MRFLGLALLVLAFTASPASAAVIEIEENFCGCDPSSGDEDTRSIIVTAQPGEQNAIAVERLPRGIRIRDDGALLTGACRPAGSGGGRFCRGAFDGVNAKLGDGDDSLTSAVEGSVDGGAGDDQIHTGGVFSELSGGPGADLLDATGSLGAAVSYEDHTDGVTVLLDGVADDGSTGEGDNVLGPVRAMTGGDGNDRLEAGPNTSFLSGRGGDDVLIGSPDGDTIDGEGGDDVLSGLGGNDILRGEEGADDLSGGDGQDETSYAGSTAPLQLSIGGGADDGAAGEGDNIHDDIEALAGGSGNDVLIGNAGANRLIAYGGQDVLRGGAGPDELLGWDDGDELDAGPGPDRVHAGSLDRPLLVDGEADRLDCGRRAPAIEADPVDVLNACAPAAVVRRGSRIRRGRPVTIALRCPQESAVPCRGRLWLVSNINGLRVSPKVRFGPVEPGERTRLRTRFAARLRPGTCFIVRARTRRTDGLDSVTVSRSALGCLPIPRLAPAAAG
jgi:hypothetical protein